MTSLGSSAFRCGAVYAVGVRGDDELVVAAGDPAREFHAQFVRPSRVHGVVRTERHLDVVGQPAVPRDAFGCVPVVLDHWQAEPVGVGAIGLVVGFDQCAPHGLLTVDDVSDGPDDASRGAVRVWLTVLPSTITAIIWPLGRSCAVRPAARR